jgi:DNA polymerase-4
MERTILHSDMNNFYASVECLYNPALRSRPVVVGGDPALRHGIVLAKNEIAKRFGIKTGEVLWQAKQKCPGLVCTKPHFDLYMDFSQMAREIYSKYSDRVESYGPDECWLDVTESRALFGDGKKIADEIRTRVKSELGITSSVGVSYNKIFAKLGSDYRKPDATTVITPDNYREIVWRLPVGELLFVGRATVQKLKRYGITTIGDLAQNDVGSLEYLLGKNGRMLWNFANGLDHSPVAHRDASMLIKSVGNSTTAPRDLTSEADIKITIYLLAESVAERLRTQNLRCRTVQIHIRDNAMFSYERQGKLLVPSCLSSDLFEKAITLFYEKKATDRPVRSVGVRACDLCLDENIQLSFLNEEILRQKKETVEREVDRIRSRFGHFSIQRGIMLTDPQLSALNPAEDHLIHPEIFFKNIDNSRGG